MEADYPHCDSTWPHTQRTIGEQIAGLPGHHPEGDMGERLAHYQHPVPIAVQNDPNAF